MFPERNPTTIPPERRTRSGSNVRSHDDCHQAPSRRNSSTSSTRSRSRPKSRSWTSNAACNACSQSAGVASATSERRSSASLAGDGHLGRAASSRRGVRSSPPATPTPAAPRRRRWPRRSRIPLRSTRRAARSPAYVQIESATDGVTIRGTRTVEPPRAHLGPDNVPLASGWSRR